MGQPDYSRYFYNMDPHINPDTGVWDDNYYANTGRFLTPGGGQGAFNFDYAGEAQKAYGELGTYYDKILQDSKGDMNKALARLKEDYDRGIRFKKEDTAKAVEVSNKNVQNNALARGLYQKSAYEPPTGPQQGFGIPTENFTRATQDLNTGLNRYLETTGVNLARQQTDLPLAEQRKETDLEQQRRQQAGELANTRGGQALQKYQANLI